MTFICDPVHFVSVSLAVALLHCSTLCLIVAVELTHTENTHAYRIYGGDFFKPNILRVSCVFLINRLKKSECRKGWFVHSFYEKGQWDWGGTVGGVVALQAGVAYILHFTYAFYATCCSQHSHRSSSYTPISLFSTLSYLPYHSSSSLDLAWLIFNIVSWFLFSLPLAPLLLFYFLSCHLLYAVSLSCRDLWSATCHHHHPRPQRGK